MAQEGLTADQKNVRRQRAHLVLIDETGLFLNPLVRRSWAPRGQPPVIGGDGGHRKKVSVIGAVSVSPAAQRLGLYFSTLPDGFFTAEAVVAFLRDLLTHLRGKVVVLWDGGGNHKGPVIRSFLARNRPRTLERLPPYAPDLNPVEFVWSWPSTGNWRTLCPMEWTNWTTRSASDSSHSSATTAYFVNSGMARIYRSRSTIIVQGWLPADQ